MGVLLAWWLQKQLSYQKMTQVFMLKPPFVANMSAGHAATHNTSLQRSFSIVNVSYR